jgi:ABC-2 type transport system permease protein
VHGVFAIAVREWRSMFGRPLAYAVLSLFVLLFALLTLWFDDWLLAGSASLRRPLFWASACLLFLVPAITMRALADEWRSGTWAVLGALPVGPTEIVVGKWLGAVGLAGLALLLTLPWPLALFVLGDPDPGPIALGYLGLWLGAGALAAVGIAASALTESQVVAFLATFAVGLVPWLVGQALPLVPAGAVSWVQQLTFDHHYGNLARGVLDTRSVVAFLAATALGLRVAVQAVERRRLR